MAWFLASVFRIEVRGFSFCFSFFVFSFLVVVFGLTFVCFSLFPWRAGFFFFSFLVVGSCLGGRDSDG